MNRQAFATVVLPMPEVQGMSYCEATAAKAAEVLGIQKDAVLVASTGVIGMQLKMTESEAGSEDHRLLTAYRRRSSGSKAIMTTDTVP